jgi:flagellar basal-body rod modification protein FlgD
MPGIGRPNTGSNRFAGIQMKKAAEKYNKENVGDVLNKISGRREDINVLPIGAKHNEIGKDEFLKLLTHQLKNQDPMKPQDQNKFAADLAQFSQLEQLSNMRTEMKKFTQNQPSQMKYMAASFLGKRVASTGNTIFHRGKGENTKVYFSLKAPAEKVVVRVVDKSGATVRQIDLEKLAPGLHNIPWDGISNDGSYAGKGEFKIWTMAWDKNSQQIPIEANTEGLVTDVELENGEAILTVGGKKVNLRDVSRFQINSQESTGKKLN